MKRPSTRNRRKADAAEETTQCLLSAAGQCGLAAFKLVVSHGSETFELVDHAGFLPLKCILDLRSQPAALQPSWIKRYFLKMVLVPLVSSYLNEKTTNWSEMILRAHEYNFCANEISFLSTEYHVLTDSNAIAHYLCNPNPDNLHGNQATLLYFSLSGSARSTFFSRLETGGSPLAGQLSSHAALPPGLTCRASPRGESLAVCDCHNLEHNSGSYAEPGRLAELHAIPPAAPDSVLLNDEFKSQVDDCAAPPPGPPYKSSPCAESHADCDCHNFEPNYGLYVAPGLLADLHVFPSAPPNSVELNDMFKSEEFESLVAKAENENKKKPAKKQKSQEKIMNQCYSKFIGEKFVDVLRNGQIQAVNRSGVLLPLLPKDDSAFKFCTNPDYELPIYRFRLTKHSKSDPSDSFQITILFCPKCKRFVSIIWNRRFEPVLSEEEFDTPFDLCHLSNTLLNTVKRDAFFVEHFQPLPEMDDGLPITYQRAKWLLDRAKIWFLKDDAHKDLNAPVAVVGDVHGEITTVQKIYDLAVTDRNVPLVMLGDICDRGENSVWVALLVATMKLFDPSGLHLSAARKSRNERSE